MQWILLLAAFGSGLILPLQPGINAQLRTHLDSPFAAALVSFAGGTLALLIITLVAARPSPEVFSKLHAVPWWAWTGGLIGAVFVTAALILAPRLGAALLVGAAVTGQLIGSMVVDHFGWVGFPVTPMNAGRVIGVLLLVVGVLVVQWSSMRA